MWDVVSALLAAWDIRWIGGASSWYTPFGLHGQANVNNQWNTEAAASL